eukprot:TRINITY_DN11734_c0_g1_i1.p1 TRINITY_DN11734_c0_g1~~TRINITY_DN11734_c0_g1_i1.p1  ORF type:complete len:286 (-),score=62.59 TRINITY_DN11734_c0_g1_i1:154-1011(-)
MAKLTLNSTVTFNNGVVCPMVGLGTYKITGYENVKQSILWAWKAGYRMIDTAQFYNNEEHIGQALKELQLPRAEIFVTTKIWYSEHGYEKAKKSSFDSLKALGLDYIDLLLIHHPDAGGKSAEENNKLRAGTWKAMEEFMEEGKARAIGVSNYTVGHLQALLQTCKHKPAVNQVELHPLLAQEDLVNYCNQNGIVVQAYSSLGKGKLLNNPALTKMAHKNNKSTAQLLLRYGLQRGVIILPKSSDQKRMLSNVDIFDFEISEEDMKALNSMNQNWHCTWDPTSTL